VNARVQDKHTHNQARDVDVGQSLAAPFGSLGKHKEMISEISVKWRWFLHSRFAEEVCLCDNGEY
jgi:hypothetical protein